MPVLEPIPSAAEHASWRLPELPSPQDYAPTDPSAEAPSVVWVRSTDLRLHDNPALHAASRSGAAVVAVFVLPAVREQGGWPVCGAAAYWLHHSINNLAHSLKRLGSALVLARAGDGGSAGALLGVVAECGAERLLYNAAYAPWEVAIEEEVVSSFLSFGLGVERFPGNVLYEPSVARPDERSHHHGFGSVGFFLAAVAHLDRPLPLGPPARLRPPYRWPSSLRLGELGLARAPIRKDGTKVDWARVLRCEWCVGEEGARAALRRFVDETIRGYDGRERHRADQRRTSELSPHLRFGEVSSREILDVVLRAKGEKASPTFLRKFAWRDLAYWSLWRFPNLADVSFRPQYEEQSWHGSGDDAEAWRTGRTGYPLVDAAMRQLWATGWLPNYMRHVVASFLIEYLGCDWRVGERWFDHTLVDADPAINAFMWQNGGHSGMDQWNFVMHPVFAAKTCDPEGEYTRRWLPELALLPTEFVHCPWEAPTSMRAAAGVHLGSTYPKRVVTNLEAARRASHAAVMSIRRGAGARYILPSGHEWRALEDGTRVVLITRKDYREGGDEIVTKQSAAKKWDVRQRERTDWLSCAMRDSFETYERSSGVAL